MINNIDRILVRPKTSQKWEEKSSQSLTQILISQFNQAGVLYCHWKSKSLEGESDIDFLVSNQSLATATVVLLQLGFKAASPRWGKIQPCVFHYYAYDADLNEYVHLHMFTRVLTGERLVKSHLYPFEEMLFKDTYTINGLVVTSKEAELVLFIIKTFIRYGSLLDIRQVLRADGKFKEEFHDLKTGSDMTKVMDYISRYCPVVEEALFLDCVSAIEESAWYPRKWVLAQKMRWQLRVYQNTSMIGRWLGYAEFLGATLTKRFKRQAGNKILVAGGAIIAVVGADATGKSTLVEAASIWLRKIFVLRTVHAGKPPSSLLTLPINLLIALNRELSRQFGYKNKVEQGSPSNAVEVRSEDKKQKSLFYAIRAVCLAWDRRTLLLKARRASTKGEIIVCDRYPTNATGMMDSPRLVEDLTQTGLRKSLKNWLARVERTIYRQIPPPDIVLRLEVSMENAKQRNVAREIVDDEVYLQNRHQQVKDWYVSGARNIRNIDTNHSLAETIADIKQVIWSTL
jgi:thymidylate kinase